ncbi:anthranilate synthase family protein [Vibrio ruber]|uniref:anthranilate synthase family protein n=1 Tax=Vibrio ruber TaxID=184755 RepID=UPI0028936713|nr:anthranilate synthase family protein [Vibrio ruber]WNJ96985.1 anthranilate synthase family protein [Vibrio ruber]
MTQLILLPFNQLKEKGYACIDDNEQTIVMQIERQTYYSIDMFMSAINDRDIQPTNLHFDLDDQAYGEIVNTVIDQEINVGEGSNFVISRNLEGDISDFSTAHALTMFKRLLQSECGSYWTWIAFTGTRYFIGSTPEQHIQIDGQHVAMNPISGTLKYPPATHIEHALNEFLQDKKERDELFMVVDEELKMMSQICQSNIRVSGPKLKAMSHVAHTEYFIHGKSELSIKDIIRLSLFAPTVTGSPIESACKVIARRENRGRGYYSGVVAMNGTRGGKRYLDSAIMIRTADISTHGHFRLTSGSTIVRSSVAENEASETRAKLQGLMQSFFSNIAPTNPERRGLSAELCNRADQILAQRNVDASAFWLGYMQKNVSPVPLHRSITLVDMEDTFTTMIAYQLRSIGYTVNIIPWNDSLYQIQQLSDRDIVFIGPGPGDPTNLQLEKIRVARQIIAKQLKNHRPLIGTCLGHQLICTELGIPITRLAKNRQGSQQQIMIQEQSHSVGFYNSFSAIHIQPEWYSAAYDQTVRLERLPSNEIIALSSGNVASIQFHNESFLTQDTFSIYQWLIQHATEIATHRSLTT